MAKTVNPLKAFLTILVILNLIPIVGASLKLWEWYQVLYVYWAECAVIGLAIFVSYAKHLFIFFAILITSALLLHVSDTIAPNALKILLIFWSLYSLCWLGYFELANSSFGLKIRRKPPLTQIAFYLTCMASFIAFSTFVTSQLYHTSYILEFYERSTLTLLLLLTIFVPTLTIISLRIIHIVGAKHFLYFLLGTYHVPKESEKVVLFLDMIDSTKIAEKLSPKDSMSLISHFIFDASSIIRKHGGDIINYTGDGLVVLWPIKKADRAIEAIYNMRKRFNKIRPKYQKEFGVKPYFRMGVHAGPVVISQIGEEKLFLGLYGDTVNTASRLEQMNKDLETYVLISQPVVDQLSLKWISKLLPLGNKDVPGRKEPIEAYALRLRADTPDPDRPEKDS